MKISEQGLNLIKRHEGLRLEAYLDAAGKKTIGYGHLMLPGDKTPDKILPDQADALLKQDVEEAERAVRAYVKVPLKQGQFDALVSFTFNYGPGNLKASQLLAKTNAGEFHRAAQEFGRWILVNSGKGWEPLPGLIQRRADEAKLFIA